MISEDKGTCSVTFEGYGTTEIVKVHCTCVCCCVLLTNNSVKLSELRPENATEERGVKRKGAQQLMKSKANKLVYK